MILETLLLIILKTVWICVYSRERDRNNEEKEEKVFIKQEPVDGK